MQMYLQAGLASKRLPYCNSETTRECEGTQLQKQIAILSQMLNLKETDMLAKFLGHDIHIHREYYRLPEQTHPVVPGIMEKL